MAPLPSGWPHMLASMPVTCSVPRPSLEDPPSVLHPSTRRARCPPAHSPEAPAPYQPCGLQGLVLCSRDRAGSAITLTILQGFPWGKVGAMLGAKAHPETTGAGPAALQQPPQPLCRVKPCETHLSSRLVATQPLSITYSGTVSARGQAGAMRGVTKPARAYAFSALGCKPLCRGRAERALHPSRVSAPRASTALHLEDASRIYMLLLPIDATSSFETSSQSSGSLGNGWFGPAARVWGKLRGGRLVLPMLRGSAALLFSYHCA